MTDLVCHALTVSRVLCILHLKSQIGQECIGDGTKTKAREQTGMLMNNNTPRPQIDIDKTADIDEVAFDKLQIRQSSVKKELIEVTDSLIPPPPTETPGDMTKNYQEQRESYNNKKRNTIYIKEYM